MHITTAGCALGSVLMRETDNSFLVLFFKKELLPCFLDLSQCEGAHAAYRRPWSMQAT
jgi:hypothetical protein